MAVGKVLGSAAAFKTLGRYRLSIFPSVSRTLPQGNAHFWDVVFSVVSGFRGFQFSKKSKEYLSLFCTDDVGHFSGNGKWSDQIRISEHMPFSKRNAPKQAEREIKG